MNTLICSVLLLLTDDFYKHTYSVTSIELAVENLFPHAEIQAPIGHRDNHFAAHRFSARMRNGSGGAVFRDFASAPDLHRYISELVHGFYGRVVLPIR